MKNQTYVANFTYEKIIQAIAKSMVSVPRFICFLFYFKISEINQMIFYLFFF
jgi:hypothetical protein